MKYPDGYATRIEISNLKTESYLADVYYNWYSTPQWLINPKHQAFDLTISRSVVAFVTVESLVVYLTLPLKSNTQLSLFDLNPALSTISQNNDNVPPPKKMCIMNSNLTLDINALVESAISQWRESALRRKKAEALVIGVLTISSERIYDICSGNGGEVRYICDVRPLGLPNTTDIANAHSVRSRIPRIGRPSKKRPNKSPQKETNLKSGLGELRDRFSALLKAFTGSKYGAYREGFTVMLAITWTFISSMGEWKEDQVHSWLATIDEDMISKLSKQPGCDDADASEKLHVILRVRDEVVRIFCEKYQNGF